MPPVIRTVRDCWHDANGHITQWRGHICKWHSLRIAVNTVDTADATWYPFDTNRINTDDNTCEDWTQRHQQEIGDVCNQAAKNKLSQDLQFDVTATKRCEKTADFTTPMPHPGSTRISTVVTTETSQSGEVYPLGKRMSLYRLLLCFALANIPLVAIRASYHNLPTTLAQGNEMIRCWFYLSVLITTCPALPTLYHILFSNIVHFRILWKETYLASKDAEEE